MKWTVIVALTLLLITLLVVYLRYENRPVVIPRTEVKELAKPLKAKRPSSPKSQSRSPIDISGPLKDRQLRSWILPEYPEWAKEQGITGSLRMKIWVTPRGNVNSFMQPELLTTDPRLDEKAVEAIRQWRFNELPDAVGDQWGVITIRYSLLAQEMKGQEASFRGVPLAGSAISGAWHCVKQWIGKEYRYYCRLVAAPVTQ